MLFQSCFHQVWWKTSLENVLLPIHITDIFSKKSNTLRIPSSVRGEPSEIRDVSSAYWDSLYYTSPILVPFMSLLYRIIISRISAQRRKRLGNIGSPCLQPLWGYM